MQPKSIVFVCHLTIWNERILFYKHVQDNLKLLCALPTRKWIRAKKKTRRELTILSRARSQRICLIFSLISKWLELVIARIWAINCERIFASLDRLNRIITSIIHTKDFSKNALEKNPYLPNPISIRDDWQNNFSNIWYKSIGFLEYHFETWRREIRQRKDWTIDTYW